MSLPGPDARVVELRVPGLIGISGEQLLDSVATVKVAGDDSGELVRPADRLGRPAPGPVLQALGRSLPRTLEGYLWGKMTSGGAAKATWALLFPFSLANVAHGMLPAPREGNRAAAALLAVCQAMLRIVGLLLTALLVTQLGVISLDLLAAQCLAPGRSCLSWAPGWVRGNEGVRTAIGLLPPLLVIAALHRVSVVSWKHAGVRITGFETTTAAARGTTAAPGTGALPGDALHRNPNAGVLRGLHTLTSLACIALLPLGGVFTPPSGAGPRAAWVVAVVLLVLAVVATAALDDVAHWLRRVFPPPVMTALIAASTALVLLAGVTGTPLGTGSEQALAGVDAMAEGLLYAMLLTWTAFAVLLAPLALLSRGTWRTLPRRLRPWLGGWAAAPTALLACLIGAGFGAGLSISVRELLNAKWDLPPSYQSITLLWGAATVVVAVLWIGLYAVAIPLRRRRRGVPIIVRMLQGGRDEQKQAAAAWATAIVERKYLHRVVAAGVLLLALGGLALVVRRFAGWPMPAVLEPLVGLGVLALGLVAAGLLRIVYTAARTPERSRHLGALADLVYFWPRRAHPIVPPSYALKVVPDLVDRAAEHLREPSTRVVLSGYSHGGLLAIIAAARLADSVDDEQAERIGLLTAGTPAQWGYQRAFPGLLPPETLAALYGRLEGRWRGMCRGTDPFGGGVTTWRHQVVGGKLLGVGYTTDGGIGPLAPAVPGVAGALVIGGDHWLPDPVARPIDGRRWASGVLRHTDYLVDPEWDRAVAIAAGLEQPTASGALAPRHAVDDQPALFNDLPRLP